MILHWISLPREVMILIDMIEAMRTDLYKHVSKYTKRSGEAINGVELVFQNLTINDSGCYTCLAINHIGHDFLNMCLNVIERKDNQHFLEHGQNVY